ncbi:MAG TPA: hypothetical protein VIT93_07075 [Dehalococcoidia bacterium]
MKTTLPKTTKSEPRRGVPDVHSPFSSLIAIGQAIKLRNPFIRDRTQGGTKLVSEHPASAFAESFRLLALNLQVMLAESENKAVAVISPYAGDGRSCIAANLAVTLGEAGHTLLVECSQDEDGSLREMMLAERRNGAEAPAAIPVGSLATRHPGVWLLPGTVARVRNEPGALQEAAARASKDGIYTIVDTPPAAKSSTAFSLAREVGQAIYVLPSKTPDLDVHRRIKEQLERLDVRILGLVTDEA